VAATAITLVAEELQAKARWRHVATEDGVRVSVLPDDKRDVPLFRGETVISAPILELLAILTDVNRACDWNARCLESRVMRRTDDLNLMFYSRVDGPWPVSDRDAIFRARARILKHGRKVLATFDAIPWPKLKVPSGTVRFARLHGSYTMIALSPFRTKVTYQIDAHPGGMVPDWVVRYTSKWVPVGTLAGLRRQSRRIGKRYAAFVARHRPKVVQAGASATPRAPRAH